MASTSKVHFGCISGCLDIFTLRYRWFGAAWQYQDEHQIVLGFWFGDNIQEIIQQANNAGWHSFDHSNVPKDARSVYDHIRNQQKQQDWDKRSRLPLRTAFKKPWKDVREGWYVIRSRSIYPLYVSAVYRRKYSVWVEHVCLCEDQVDLDHFIEQVNQDYKMNLQVL